MQNAQILTVTAALEKALEQKVVAVTFSSYDEQNDQFSFLVNDQKLTVEGEFLSDINESDFLESQDIEFIFLIEAMHNIALSFIDSEDTLKSIQFSFD